ncbi:hypothetical protein E3N88_40052 [Mikania micrantha]|uniref:Uncharacterized protein n=1 Tax=Mikania micrantha TaxID=192012 RepID=A0A5N6LLK7_9ASTR|nr:hypothetical protein E3N88_40052 [Mikania micrantha]
MDYRWKLKLHLWVMSLVNQLANCYLTETPAACNDKVVELLGFIVSVQGEDEQSPFYSVCFLLPMLCQITMEADGCQLIVSSETYKATKQIRGHLDDAYFIRLMGVMSSWAVINSTSGIMLRHNPHFNHDNLISLCQLMRRSLATDGKYADSEADLHQIVVSGWRPTTGWRSTGLDGGCGWEAKVDGIRRWL